MLTETKRVENHDRVVELLNSVERDDISDLLKWLEESDFFTAPASRAYHSLYGTPIESTTYKFAKCLQKRFGVIEGITDRNYITNSYHVHVTEKINAFDKLRFESEFQLLSPGGAISYIETANLSNNVEAAIKVIQYIYDHIMYAELNTKSDFCQECGYDGEIQIVENEDGKYIWECPNCGNRDRAKMNIARRTYIPFNDRYIGRWTICREIKRHLFRV